jgi:enamine deaminase RidA (YjgF/YER057c/UK114 family)
MSDPAPTTPGIGHVNPTAWSRQRGHDQGQLREGIRSILTIGGQRPVDADGRLMHEGDTVAQVALALDNLTAVVVAAGMTLADLAYLRVHTTSLAALVDAQFVVDEHLAEHALTTPITTIEVSSLALAGMEVEIDGLAVRTEPRTEGTPS